MAQASAAYITLNWPARFYDKAVPIHASYFKAK